MEDNQDRSASTPNQAIRPSQGFECYKLYEEIVRITNNEKPYIDRKAGLSEEDYLDKLAKSTTLYIGNLCGGDNEQYCTEEHQIMELFSLCGEVKNVIMGLNKNTGTPCGFSFVEYFTREDAESAKRCLNLKVLDGKEIRIDFDIGFKEGRQYGRGKFGGQVRSDIRNSKR